MALKFRSPVGDDVDKLWPGEWFDATGYMTKYNGDQYHTGADLNLNDPSWNSDKGLNVYAAARGVVTYSKLRSDGWGNLIVIEHVDPCSGLVVAYTRYAHLFDKTVTEGDEVKYGQIIGHIGGTGGWTEHLHFDVSETNVLKARPNHWPGAAAGLVYDNYSDPKAFIEAHRAETSLTQHEKRMLYARMTRLAERLKGLRYD